MENKNAKQKDLLHEGKDQYFLDVDRMINEGLAGGNVYESNENTNIEEARDLTEEEPPHIIE